MRTGRELKAAAKTALNRRYWLLVGVLVVSSIIISGSVSFGYSFENFNVSFYPYLITVFAGAPLSMGLMYFLIMYLRGNPDVEFGTMFEYGFGGGRYWRHVGGYMWRSLMLFLWSLFLIIPVVLLVVSTVCIAAGSGAIPNLVYGYHYGMWNSLWALRSAVWIMVAAVPVSILCAIPVMIKSLAYSMQPFIVTMFPSVGVMDALKISMRVMKGHKGRLFGLYLSFIGWFILCGMTFGILYVFYVGPYLRLTATGFYEDVMRDALNRGVVTPQEMGLVSA